MISGNRKDPDVPDKVWKAAESVVGASNVPRDQGTMVSEDFRSLAKGIPACYFLVGTQGAAGGGAEPLDSPRFVIDE
jgi:metal-dependent amidase/aminoacylase/carboxypeptidase family protein